MNTLRVRIALLLVVLILAVEGLLAAAALLVLGPPGSPHSIEPVARQVLMLATLASGGKAEDVPGLAPTIALPDGHLEPGLTEWLRHTLHHMGSGLAVEVLRPPPPAAYVVAIPIEGRGWLAMPMPDLPPPEGLFRPLLQYLFLITVTAIPVALLAAYRMTRPLALLEDAISRVGPDARLPELPVRGPAEVRATAVALNRLSARLQSAVESRMRLVAAAGHDLRTPMTRMRLRAEFLEPEDRGPWLSDLEELDHIADSAIALVREEVTPEASEPQRLDVLMGEVLAELSDQGLNAAGDTISPVSANIGKLAAKRALRNLVINAATHGRGAKVSVGMLEGRAAVTIQDDGPGLTEAQLAQVFEPFFRADPGRGKPILGAGLGLSIAHEIVTRAGGQIRIANRLPHGLKVEVLLPIAAASAG